MFDELVEKILQKTEFIIENRKKLQYYISHQTRKIYLNAQFNAQLFKLNEEGMVMVADYKMRILKKTAREVKSDFFGKSGWTLHTILVYTKMPTSNELQIQVFDHWSSDTV